MYEGFRSVDDKNSDRAKLLSKFINDFTSLHNALQESDWPPTVQVINANATTGKFGANLPIGGTTLPTLANTFFSTA